MGRMRRRLRRGDDAEETRLRCVEISNRHDISFIILTWNSAASIEHCLASIHAVAKSLNVMTCVIDNGSTDETPAILQRAAERFPEIALDIVWLPENRGTTISRNIGIRHVADRARYLCILDSDAFITTEALQNMMCVLEETPHAGIVGPVLRSEDGTMQNSGRAVPTLTLKLLKVLPIASLRRRGEQMEEIEKPAGAVVPVGYLMSACWLMKSSLVRDIGLLDEHIFYAPEDVEYCLRAWTKGYRVLYDGRAAITHVWQRLSRKKLLSRHNWEHLKGLAYLFYKYRYCFRSRKFDRYRTQGE